MRSASCCARSDCSIARRSASAIFLSGAWLRTAATESPASVNTTVTRSEPSGAADLSRDMLRAEDAAGFAACAVVGTRLARKAAGRSRARIFDTGNPQLVVRRSRSAGFLAVLLSDRERHHRCPCGERSSRRPARSSREQTPARTPRVIVELKEMKTPSRLADLRRSPKSAGGFRGSTSPLKQPGGRDARRAVPPKGNPRLRKALVQSGSIAARSLAPCTGGGACGVESPPPPGSRGE